MWSIGSGGVAGGMMAGVGLAVGAGDGVARSAWDWWFCCWWNNNSGEAPILAICNRLWQCGWNEDMSCAMAWALIMASTGRGSGDWGSCEAQCGTNLSGSANRMVAARIWAACWVMDLLLAGSWMVRMSSTVSSKDLYTSLSLPLVSFFSCWIAATKVGCWSSRGSRWMRTAICCSESSNSAMCQKQTAGQQTPATNELTGAVHRSTGDVGSSRQPQTRKSTATWLAGQCHRKILHTQTASRPAGRPLTLAFISSDRQTCRPPLIHVALSPSLS